jgi:hypothetical protein
MLHTCVQRFDVTGNLKILAKFLASKRAVGRRFTLKEEWYFFDRLITTPSQFLPATTKLAVAPDQHLAHLDSVKQAL